MALSVVTGANRGIGLALTQLLRQRGDTVVAACRRRSAALEATGAEVVEGVDVTAAEGAERLKQAVGARGIDVLIHNAGILLWNEGLEGVDPRAIRSQFETNAIGPLMLTVALLDKLGRGSKIAIITSRMGSIEDNGSGGAYGYRMSKAALNMAGKSLAIDLEPRGVAVTILHPGMVRTDMVGGQGQVEPEEAARGLLQRIDELTLQTSGSFWHANGQKLPW